VQPAGQLCGDGQVRYRVLSQRVDLLFGRGEEGHPAADSQYVEAGRVSVFGCFGGVERVDGSLSDGSVQSRDYLSGQVTSGSWIEKMTSLWRGFFMGGITWSPCRSNRRLRRSRCGGSGVPGLCVYPLFVCAVVMVPPLLRVTFGKPPQKVLLLVWP